VTSKPDFKVMVLLLVFMQLTRDLFAIAKFLLLFTQLLSLPQTHYCLASPISQQATIRNRQL